MMARAGLWAVLAAFIFSAGCAAHAEKLAELNVGMKQPQVVKVLGKPEKIIKVRFQGHEDSYLVWQYQMMPDIPTGPEEGVGRWLTGMATLGLSEVAWTNAKAEPHWVYFIDGAVVYTSPGFDCDNNDTCEYKGDGPHRDLTTTETALVSTNEMARTGIGPRLKQRLGVQMRWPAQGFDHDGISACDYLGGTPARRNNLRGWKEI